MTSLHGCLNVQASNPAVDRPGKENVAYYKIAAHYKWALGRLFDEEGHKCARLCGGKSFSHTVMQGKTLAKGLSDSCVFSS
jgi:hypothetical protein